MDQTTDPGKLWVFVVPRPGTYEAEFREWCAEHPDLFVVVTERRPRAPQVFLHRATCTLPTPDAAAGPHLWECGPRALLEDAFSQSEIIPCRVCL
jgi:hypothetical protein